MKRILPFLSLLLLSAATLQAAEETTTAPRMPGVLVEGVFGAGYRLFGKQIDVAHDALTPAPDYYVNFFYGARLSVFPARWGIQAGYQRALFRAASFSAGGGYSVFNYDTIDAGIAYSLPLQRATEGENQTFLVFGAGLNYSMLSYADQFKSDLKASANKQGVTLVFDPNAATGVGGYLQAGALIFFGQNIFLSATARLSYINAKFTGASTPLDSWGIDVPLSVGLAF